MSTSKRETLADTFALISFGLIIGMAVEIFIAGLSVEQSMQSRLLSIPINMLIARPYGMYRDWIMSFRHLMDRLPGAGTVGDTVLDIFAFVSFQIPVYAALIATTGASIEQIITASVGQIGALIVMARPYGMYMQACRNWFVTGRLRTV